MIHIVPTDCTVVCNIKGGKYNYDSIQDKSIRRVLLISDMKEKENGTNRSNCVEISC